MLTVCALAPSATWGPCVRWGFGGATLDAYSLPRPQRIPSSPRGLCMAGTVRLLLRVTGFKNARDVAKVWVHTEGSTWYTDDDAWYVANHDIDPDTNSLVTYVDGVPSGSEGAPCAGN